MQKGAPLLIYTLFLTSLSYAQPGSLDGDFDADGKIITPITNVNDYAQSIVVQPDGKIIITGISGISGNSSENRNFTTVRYHTDGSLDQSFGDGGIVITDFDDTDGARSVVLQSDGKIIVAGIARGFFDLPSFALVRYNADGTLDESFGSLGKITGPVGEAFAMALQVDGKIVVAGKDFSNTKFCVARYHSDGVLDASFGTAGVVLLQIGSVDDQVRSIAIQPDGRIIVAGSSDNGNDLDFAMVRLMPDGSLDNSFSVNGMVTTAIGNDFDSGSSVLIQPDGKIVVAGSSYGTGAEPNKIAIVRYNSNGLLDNSFSADGKATTSNDGESCVGSSVVLQSDGKLVVAGTGDEEFIIVRFNEDGTLDDKFDTDGIVTTLVGVASGASSVAIQPDGRIVVAGYGNTGTGAEFGLARYISGSDLGVISFSKQDHGLLVYPNPIRENAVIEYTLIADETISIDLYDISGGLVQSFAKSEKRTKGDHKESLAIDASVPSGTYILTLTNGKGWASIRVVK